MWFVIIITKGNNNNNKKKGVKFVDAWLIGKENNNWRGCFLNEEKKIIKVWSLIIK